MIPVPPLPDAVPQEGGPIGRALGRTVLGLLGWRFEGAFPDVPKFVCIVAPHTSNWDFIVGFSAKLALGLRASWFGKHTLFRPPVGWLLRRTGGIPVDRRGSADVVASLAREFATRERLVLALAPEGTRRRVERWKSGFYHIARAADVPVFCVALDWGRRVIRLGPLVPVDANDGVDDAIDAFMARYADVRGRIAAHHWAASDGRIAAEPAPASAASSERTLRTASEPDPASRMTTPDRPLALATLGGGCFWCLDAVYRELRGVHTVTSGYAGGHVDRPTYEAVCNGTTGHAEVVQIAYDPDEIGFRDLLDVFFTIHDPTTLNRQGHDVGTQYRSAIFTHDDAQAAEARAAIAALTASGTWPDPIVTEVAPLERFWPAERYHQDYFARNPMQPYCAAVVAPKVAKARKVFFERLRRVDA